MNTTNHRMVKSVPTQRAGFTMIEVLVALIIIVLGLLGLAGMQVRMQQAEFESYQRTQALILLYDMVDRINTHRSAASCFLTSGLSPAYVGAGGTAPTTCGAAVGATEAKDSLQEWDNLLDGAAESGNAGAMVGARGCVSLNGGIYTVAVAWQGTVDTSPPKMDDGTTTINCANGLYDSGTDTRRRAVATTFRMAVLD